MAYALREMGFSMSGVQHKYAISGAFRGRLYKSIDSFQAGFNERLMTRVSYLCCPLTDITANESASPESIYKQTK